ncbi:MAG TPA: nucleotidyltransferase family protein [Thermoanaerobaculia bacterium]
MPWVIRDAPFDQTLKEAARRSQAVERTLERIARRLSEEGIEYALIGGMALMAHGYVRFTNDVDLLTSAAGLEAIHQRLIGRGYRPSFPGARRTMRDTETGIDVEFITSGEYPGDGKPKPVRFPEPGAFSVVRGDVYVLDLPKIIELKLASGLTAEHRRYRDLGDVQSLISALELARDLGDALDPSVRDEYYRLWDADRNAEGPDRQD